MASRIQALEERHIGSKKNHHLSCSCSTGGRNGISKVFFYDHGVVSRPVFATLKKVYTVS